MSLDATVGGAAADTYVTLAEWADWAAGMGYTLTGTDTARETILRRAARALDDRYSFSGHRFQENQALAWPRAEVGHVHGWEVRSDAIPAEIRRAQMEMALAIMRGVDPFPVTVGTVVSESSSVGPLSRSVTYVGGKGRPAIAPVDRIVRPYLSAGGGVSEVMRA